MPWKEASVMDEPIYFIARLFWGTPSDFGHTMGFFDEESDRFTSCEDLFGVKMLI